MIDTVQNDHSHNYVDLCGRKPDAAGRGCAGARRLVTVSSDQTSRSWGRYRVRHMKAGHDRSDGGVQALQRTLQHGQGIRHYDDAGATPSQHPPGHRQRLQ
eukprot:723237-Rhodomonas_salina.2